MKTVMMMGVCVACLAIHIDALAQLYKCSDPAGKTVYQQGPCSGDKAEGKLELQDQVSGERYGGSKRGAFPGVTDKEFEAIVAQARRNAQRGKCEYEIPPTLMLTQDQRKRLVLECDEASKPFYRNKDIAAEKAERVGPPRIGMKAEQVLAGKWGEPEKVNKTTTAYGVREQWVYSRPLRYVYVENGVVVALQE